MDHHKRFRRAVDKDNILFILDTHFLEQCLTHNRHPINISRIIPPSPDLPSMSKLRDQVFSRPFPSQWAPESLQFPQGCAVFWQASQRGPCLIKQVSVYAASLGTVAMGAWFALLMRQVFFFFFFLVDGG